MVPLPAPRGVIRFTAICLVILFTLMLTPASAAQSSAPAQQQTPETTLQQALLDTFQQRIDSGLPAPDIRFNTTIPMPNSLPTAGASPQMVMSTTTTIHFDGPQDIGLAEWPRLMVPVDFEDENTGAVREVDYTDRLLAAIERDSSGVFDQIAFGQEARTLTLTELVIQPPASSANPAPTASTIRSNETLLMGFTYQGPTPPILQYVINQELGIPNTTIRFNIRVGYELSWAFGLRLPIQLAVTSPVATEWQSYTATAQLNPLNWSPSQYAAWGVAAENGNEFVARFTGQLFLEVSFLPGRKTFGPSGNWGRSFATPIGANNRIPVTGSGNIPLFSVPLTFGIANIRINFGTSLDALMSSDRITADWRVISTGNAVGSGSLTFTAPSRPVILGPIYIDDAPPGSFEVELSNFRYRFTQFRLQIMLNTSVTASVFWFEPVLIYRSPPILIAEVNLDQIVGGTDVLYVSNHLQCNTTTTVILACAPLGPDNLLQWSIPLDLGMNASLVRNYNTVNQVVLTWGGVSWATSYEVEIARDPAFQTATRYTVGNSQSFATPTLATGRYYWRVRALQSNGVSWGGWSAPDSFVIDLD